jgi:hypothetical protein
MEPNTFIELEDGTTRYAHGNPVVVTTDGRVEILRKYKTTIGVYGQPGVTFTIDTPLRYTPEAADRRPPLSDAARNECMRYACKRERQMSHTAHDTDFVLVDVEYLGSRLVPARVEK